MEYGAGIKLDAVKPFAQEACTNTLAGVCVHDRPWPRADSCVAKRRRPPSPPRKRLSPANKKVQQAVAPRQNNIPRHQDFRRRRERVFHGRCHSLSFANLTFRVTPMAFLRCTIKPYLGPQSNKTVLSPTNPPNSVAPIAPECEKEDTV